MNNRQPISTFLGIAAAVVLATNSHANDIGCPADLTGDGTVNAVDLIEMLLCVGQPPVPPCDTADFNGDGAIDLVDVVYLVESFGPCPSILPGAVELFDQLIAVDSNDLQALALGLNVTHVYATGDDVGQDDALLLVNFANIDATGGTTFFQEPVFGTDTAPDCFDILIEPALEFDTFVTMALGCHNGDDETTEGVCMSDTAIDGNWYAPFPSVQREAVDISGATGQPGQFGVRIAQITLEIASDPTNLGYTGTVRLYTSTHDGGSLGGVDATVAFSACPTDVNGDRVINVLDLIDVLLCFGQPAVPGCVAEDVNGDGTVNVLDLIQLLLAFGTACP